MTVVVTPNLVQGVSQQNAQQRRDSQCESQFDCLNSPLENCVARPPFRFVALIPGAAWTNAFLHPIRRNNVNYLIGVNNDTPIAFNYDTGVAITPTISSGLAYVDHGIVQPRDAFKAQTVEDVTFIVNRIKTVAMDATTASAAKVNEGFVFVRAGAFNNKFRVKLVSGANVAETIVYTPSTAKNAQEHWLAKAESVAKSLADGQAANLSGTALVNDIDRAGNLARVAYSGLDGQNGFSADLYGTLIHVYRADGADFTIETEDGNGDDLLYGFTGFIKDFSRLPRRGLDGSVLEVAGEDRTRDDNYYVTFTGGKGGTGEWLETVGPSTIQALNATTMPHKFTWTGLNAFTYAQNSWSTRIAGDVDTAKDPSFVGSRIRDVFWANQRLGFLTERSAVWSKVRFPYTFFPDTVQAVLANAPVDAQVVAGKTNKNGVVIPDFVVKVDGSTYFWGLGVQFIVSSGQDGFKPDTVQVEETTAYEYNEKCDPTAVGSFLFFASAAGSWSAIRAVQYVNGKSNGDTDVTAHVPRYVAPVARGIVGFDTLRTLFVYADGDRDALYVYNYLYQENTFAQSAWNTWRLPGGTIIRADAVGNALRVVQQRTEGVAILECDLTPAAVDSITGATYRTRLDYLVAETQVSSLSYDADLDRSTFTLPYTPTAATLKVVIAQTGGAFVRGQTVPIVSVVGAVVVVSGDLTGRKFYAGQRVVAERTESEYYLRSEEGPIPVDRLTINNIQLDMAKTGYTRVEVNTGPQREARSYEFFGLPYQGAVVDAVNVSSGQLKVPVKEQAPLVTIRLVNDTHLPSSWQSIAWDVTPVGGKGIK